MGRMGAPSLPLKQERLNLFGTSQPPCLPPRRDPPPIPPKPAHLSNTYKGSLPPRQ
ncbi:GSCOCT00014328001.2-RA-CDS, partial [Cotesia congregata]